MDTSNVYNIFSVVDKIQSEIFRSGKVDYRAYLQVVGYEVTSANEAINEYTITSITPNNLNVNVVTANIESVVRNVLNANSKNISATLNMMGINPGDTFGYLMKSPGYFYKILNDSPTSFKIRF